ncbi:MAG TPA: hypothetical protein VGE11_27390 [Pseudonocardia sp.]
MLNKVPEITMLFWVIKIVTTGMGEAASDWLFSRGDGLPGLGVLGALVIDVTIFVVALVLQFKVRRHVPAVYWFAVVAVSIFGTVAADVVHFLIGVPLWLTATAYAAALAANFAIWYRSERTLSIHSITTRRRETFYWITVFLTFALGTALGDLTAVAWNLGYLASGVMFMVLILVPAVAHLRFGANAILAFWCAYVVTRPLGASFADWFALPKQDGGLDLGAGWVTLVLTIMIVVLVAYVALKQDGLRRRQNVP